jgi:hypothetical protein
MKLNSKGSSKYLTKADVPAPILATIADVKIETLQNPREDKPVLYFAGTALKPMVLNVTNRRVLIAAYGDETDAWRGQRVEIYVNQDVTNSSGDVVGGVRVRIPAAAPTNTAPKPPAPMSQSPPADPHAKTLSGLRAAQEASNTDAWLAWGAKQPRTPVQKREQETAYRLALERIAMTEGPAAEPELAGAHAGADIPI